MGPKFAEVTFIPKLYQTISSSGIANHRIIYSTTPMLTMQTLSMYLNVCTEGNEQFKGRGKPQRRSIISKLPNYKFQIKSLKGFFAETRNKM